MIVRPIAVLVRRCDMCVDEVTPNIFLIKEWVINFYVGEKWIPTIYALVAHSQLKIKIYCCKATS